MRMAQTVILAVFQANTSDLLIFDPSGGESLGLGMMAGTSPTIAAASDASSAAVAFQANTGNLWTYDAALGAVDRQLGMMAGTSPAICSLGAVKAYSVAFQA